MENNPDILDAVVVGAGPAGLTAAIYLGRIRRRCVVIEDGHSRAQWIPTSHNIPGFTAGVGGQAFLSTLRTQALKYGAQIRHTQPRRLHAPDRDGLDSQQLRSLGYRAARPSTSDPRCSGSGDAQSATLFVPSATPSKRSTNGLPLSVMARSANAKLNSCEITPTKSRCCMSDRQISASLAPVALNEFQLRSRTCAYERIGLPSGDRANALLTWHIWLWVAQRSTSWRGRYLQRLMSRAPCKSMRTRKLRSRGYMQSAMSCAGSIKWSSPRRKAPLRQPTFIISFAAFEVSSAVTDSALLLIAMDAGAKTKHAQCLVQPFWHTNF